jgi:hypothetical protein
LVKRGSHEEEVARGREEPPDGADAAPPEPAPARLPFFSLAHSRGGNRRKADGKLTSHFFFCWLRCTHQKEMTDSKYFTTTKKGEIKELKKELDSPKENVKKDAVKKVIAAMTVGKDVSELFPDVVKCIRTSNLELKKLVYLYIMNYAKTQPETAILSVNAFVHVRIN